MTAVYAADSFGTRHAGRVYGVILSVRLCVGICATFLFGVPAVKPVMLYAANGLALRDADNRDSHAFRTE